MPNITPTLRTIKKKEAKHILNMLKEQWGFEEPLDYHFLEGKDGNIFIMNDELSGFDISKVRINSLGLYIAQIKNSSVRLSIEGSQIIGPHATKNIIEISDKLARHWIRGIDIPYPEEKGLELNGFQIIRNNDDFLGTGIFKENRILNFVPKARRLNSED